nr:type 1 glutamine amidotransferase domain-containing protein [Allomuricauda sp.]
MFRKYRVLKWISVFIVSVILVVVSFGFWFKSLIPPRDINIESTKAGDIAYLSENIITKRGKILAVVTSTASMGNSGKTTGYELTELARAYYTFMANGFEVDIASPEGGQAPVVIDDEDMGAFDYAFLNDPVAQSKTRNTIALKEVDPDGYQAVYFAGGKGAMFDFPNNQVIQKIVKDYYQSNKVIGAVCHGPAALVNVTLDDGRPLLRDKQVSSFTNKEELLLIADARTVFPFLLQDKIEEKGAKFREGAMYLEKVSHDQNLITGQNPWSTWRLAEQMIQQLGYTPKPREITAEENAVKVISTYKDMGRSPAKQMIESMVIKERQPLDRVLIAKHGIIAAMKGEMGDFTSLVGMVSFAKKCESKSRKL